MVDTLGAVLQGLNNGAATGLDMYKTMREEERAKRAESLQLQRYAIDDARYEKSWERQVEQDRLTAERDERDHKWEKDKYEIEQERLAEAAAATAAYRAQQLQLQGANYSLRLSKYQRELLREQQGKHDTLVKDGLSVFGEAYKNDPDAAMDVYASNIYSRVGVNQQVARAQGFELDAQTASELYAMPRPDGTYVIGRHTEKGFKAYDANPDAEGEQALVMPADVFARTFAGTEGSQALTAKNAVHDMRDATLAASNGAVAQQRAGVEQRRQGVAATLADVDRQLAALKSEQTNLANFVETGNYQLSPEGGSGTVANTAPKDGIEASKRAQELQGQIEALEAQRNAATATMDDVRADSRGVRQGAADQRVALDKAWGTINGLAGKEQAVAARNFREAYAKDPALALRYPGMSLEDAGEAQQKVVNDAVDRLVSSMDSKTVFGADGKLVSLQGAKANTRAALLSMPAEMVTLTADYTGRTEGAMQKAVQDAQNAGKPQAIPYFLYSYSAGVDGKALVDLMGDKAMRGPKFNDKARFAYANRAVELMRDGKTSDPQTALGMALQEQDVSAPKIGKGSTLADVMR